MERKAKRRRRDTLSDQHAVIGIAIKFLLVASILGGIGLFVFYQSLYNTENSFAVYATLILVGLGLLLHLIGRVICMAAPKHSSVHGWLIMSIAFDVIAAAGFVWLAISMGFQFEPPSDDKVTLIGWSLFAIYVACMIAVWFYLQALRELVHYLGSWSLEGRIRSVIGWWIAWVLASAATGLTVVIGNSEVGFGGNATIPFFLIGFGVQAFVALIGTVLYVRLLVGIVKRV